MDPDVLKAIVAIVTAIIGAAAGIGRWAVVRITKSIDGGAASHVAAAEKASAAQLAAAEKSAAAQLAAAEKFATSAQQQAVAFEALRSEVHAVAAYIQDRPSSRAAGSGGRAFKPGG